MPIVKQKPDTRVHGAGRRVASAIIPRAGRALRPPAARRDVR